MVQRGKITKHDPFFLRSLAKPWYKASPEARALCQKFYQMDLPEGHTFVQWGMKGSEEASEIITRVRRRSDTSMEPDG